MSVTVDANVDWVITSIMAGSPEPSNSLSESTTSTSFEQSISFAKLTFNLLSSEQARTVRTVAPGTVSVNSFPVHGTDASRRGDCNLPGSITLRF